MIVTMKKKCVKDYWCVEKCGHNVEVVGISIVSPQNKCKC